MVQGLILLNGCVLIDLYLDRAERLEGTGGTEEHSVCTAVQCSTLVLHL